MDAQQAYAPASGPYSELVRSRGTTKSGQWRIDAVPQGVVMGKSDFQRNYTSVNKYYFASNVERDDAGLAADGGRRSPCTCAATSTPRPRWCARCSPGRRAGSIPVVRSSFPAGTQLRKGAAAAHAGRPRAR
ncbi:hypothetical protein GCM10019016_007170 [Streptomyces prasinosporus]|uniref:Lipoprotein LpqB N-terminal domain-containing protein n=1 Tax=Streptomyces prasinosporus TaxID=68256 RepID=A0ABP6TGF4_9ACTN